MSEAVAQFTPTGDVVVFDEGTRVDIPADMVPAVRALLAHGSSDPSPEALAEGTTL